MRRRAAEHQEASYQGERGSVPQADGVPDAGQIVWIDFGLPFGHEQAGRRPALVISPRAYNEKSSLMIVCPITRNSAPWPFKVDMPRMGKLHGFVIVDQVKAIDRQARRIRPAEFGAVPLEVMDRVYGTLATLFGLPVSN